MTATTTQNSAAHNAATQPVTFHAHLDHERLMDCIHCGLCLSQCPTYAEAGLEADSPRGRIYIMRALAEGRAEATPALVEHLDLCLGCRACETACPSGVQYGHLIEGARAHLRETYRRPWQQRLIMQIVEATFPYPNRMEAALLPVRVLRRTGVMGLLHRTGVMKLLGNLGDMESLLPPLPPMRRRLAFAETWPARGEAQACVGMITGCVMQVMQTPVNEATAKVLTRVGCAVAAPKTQGCCGALHAHTGAMGEAKKLAQHNIEVFEAWQREHGALDAIVINAAGCGSSLKEYPGWFKGDAAWEARARAFSSKVKDVSEFLAQPRFKDRLTARLHGSAKAPPVPAVRAADVLSNTIGASTVLGAGGTAPHSRADQVAALDPETSPLAIEPPQASSIKRQSKITYHDACHLAHGQGIRVEPRALLEAVPGLELVPLGESEMCCGSAGTYNITQSGMAMQLLERKMKHIRETSASVVVTGNPGCAMQLMLGAKKFGVPVEVRHPIEILEAATR